MTDAKIAAALLSALASGLTVERVSTELPMFRSQIESAFGWLKAKSQCTDTEIADRITHLQEIIAKKDNAIKIPDWDVAADMKGKERAIFESFGLDRLTRTGTLSASTLTPADDYIHHLAELLNGNHEPDA